LVGILISIPNSSVHAYYSPYYGLYSSGKLALGVAEARRPSYGYSRTISPIESHVVEVPYYVAEPLHQPRDLRSGDLRSVRQYYQRRSDDDQYSKRKLPLVRLRRGGGEALPLVRLRRNLKLVRL